MARIFPAPVTAPGQTTALQWRNQVEAQPDRQDQQTPAQYAHHYGPAIGNRAKSSHKEDRTENVGPPYTGQADESQKRAGPLPWERPLIRLAVRSKMRRDDQEVHRDVKSHKDQSNPARSFHCVTPYGPRA